MKKFRWDKPTRYQVELLLIILVVSVAGNIGLYYINKLYYSKEFTAAPQQLPTPEISDLPRSQASLTVLFPNAPPATTSAPLRDNFTVLDLLQTAHAVEASGEADAAFVTSIDGVRAGRGQYWSFMVNGAPAEKNPGVFILHEGDEVVWELKSY